MDDRLAEELVAEVVGEMAVVAGVDVPLQLGGLHVEHLGRHGERVDAELLGALVRERPVELRLPRGNKIHRARQLGHLELLFAEFYHRIIPLYWFSKISLHL